MKLNDLLNERNDWDDLSGHHRAGASEAEAEEIIDDIHQYLATSDLENRYPYMASMDMGMISNKVASHRYRGKAILDWIRGDDALMEDDFEEMVDDALVAINADIEDYVNN